MGGVKDTARDTLQATKHEVLGVGEELKNQGSELVGAARARAQGLAEEQKSFGADQVDGVARAANKAADELEQASPQLARYVRDAASAAGNLSTSLRERSIGDLMQDVTDFARREPVVFFGLTVAAGFALSRFLKSSAPYRSDSGPSRMSGSSYRSPYGGSDAGRDADIGQSRTPVASTHATPAEYPTGRTSTTDPMHGTGSGHSAGTTSPTGIPGGSGTSGRSVSSGAGMSPAGTTPPAGSTVAGSTSSAPTTFPSGTRSPTGTAGAIGGSGTTPKSTGGSNT